MKRRARVAVISSCCVLGPAVAAVALTVSPNPAPWFADFEDPLFGTGGSKGTFTLTRVVTGLPAGAVALGGTVSATDKSFIFEVTIDEGSRRSLTTVGVLGADVTAAGWIPGAEQDPLVDIGAVSLSFNDVQIVLDGAVGPRQTTDLFFVSFSDVPPGTRLTYWVFEAGATARIFVAEVVAVASSPEPLALYDDFNATRLDPEKWFGGDGADPVLDVIRGTRVGRLQLSNRSYGFTGSDTGNRFGLVYLGFADPEAVTAVKTTVRIDGFAVEGCPTNPAPGGSSAQLWGTFFNAGTPTPGSHLNDVAVVIDIARFAGSGAARGIFQITAAVLLCNATHNCGDVTILGSHNLGTVARRIPVKIKVQWEPDSDRFVFQRDDEPEVFSPYAVSDNSPPGIPNKLLGAWNLVPNCASQPRPKGFLNVAFDDVFVNASAVR